MVLDFPDPLGPTMAEKDCRARGVDGRSATTEGDAREGARAHLVEGPDLLPSCVRFEVLEDHLVDDESLSGTLRLWCWRR